MIISVGAACRAAHYLQRHNLRCGSFPLDWMMNYTLKDASRLFHNEFRNFFEHIKQIDSKNGKRIIQDMDNGMISMHDFPTDIGMQEYYHTFKETMQRRARRMLNALKDSKNTIFLCNRIESAENFKDFLISINAIHPANYTLINIKHTPGQNKILKEILIDTRCNNNGGGGGNASHSI